MTHTLYPTTAKFNAKSIFILPFLFKLLETMKSEERYRVDLEQISGFCYWRAPLTPGRTLGACFMFFKVLMRRILPCRIPISF